MKASEPTESEFEMLVQRAMVLARTDPAEALSLAEQAVALAFSGTSACEQVEALRVQAALLHEAGEPMRSREALERGLALLPQCSDPARRSRFHIAQGWLAFLRSDLDEALSATLAALDNDAPVDSSRCWGYNNLGLIYRALGSLDRALGCFLQARTQSQALGLSLTQGAALINLSVIHCDQGDFSAALHAAQEALPLVDASPDEYAKTAGRGHLMDSLIGLGRYDEAEVVCKELLSRRHPTAMCKVIAYVHQGRICRLRGAFAEAEKAFQRAHREAKRGELIEQQVQIAYERALVRESGGRLAAAAHVLRDALAQAEGAGLRTEAVSLLESAARVAERRRLYRVALDYVRRYQVLEREKMVKDAEHQRVLFTVELELEKARRETEQERARSARLEEEASRDGMTGLYNHATFQRMLRHHLAEGSLALVLLDVDNFKHYNDAYGHVAGDTLLQELSRLLETQLRAGDLLARYGGEEFALLLPAHSSQSALEIAERLRATVAEHSFSHTRVTISIGVACTPPITPGPSQLVEAADRALYQAKRTGKNRVVLATGFDKLD